MQYNLIGRPQFCDRLSNMFLKNRIDMIIFSSICHYTSCNFLNLLKAIDVIIKYAIKQGVTIINTRCNKVI